VKDVHSQLQTALGNFLGLQQEVRLLQSSNKILTEQVSNLLKLIGGYGVDSDWGHNLTFFVGEMGSHLQDLEELIEFENRESNFVESLKEKMKENDATCSHFAVHSPTSDAHPLNEPIELPVPVAVQPSPAAQIWGLPDTSYLEPLPGSILELKNDISNISKRIHLIQSTDPSSNLVLYGIPETDNYKETLTKNLVSTVAEKLKLHISPT